MRWGAIVAIAASSLGCTHDFSVFEPTGAADASAGLTGGGDAGNPSDASPAKDSAPPKTTDAAVPGIDAAALGDGGTCAEDCRSAATICAGVCAEDEQSCAAGCTGGDAGCSPACTTTETKCTAQCVTTCETCSSGEGCIDPTGCAAAAP